LSTQPRYSEIAPIIEELDKRIAYIAESAKNLIDDEIMTLSVESLEIKPTVFDHVENAVAPIAAQVKEAAEPVTTGISKAVEPVSEKAGEALGDAKTAVTGFASGVGKSIGGFFGGFGKKK